MKSLWSRSGRLLSVLLVATVLGLLWHMLSPEVSKDRASEPMPQKASIALEEPGFVGSDACRGCHQEQARLWLGSHHDLAMQEANEQTVLGNFDNKEFRKDGVASRFFRRDGRFLVRTDGPDGKLTEFEVKYTFGVTPLQQYLVELPGGRLQALSIAWDSRTKRQGGQRWFHLYATERIDHKDELHWTKLSQNWNYMCAECHSTNLQKNYDTANRTYRTTWSEIDVACEACHGPGSQHVIFAERKPGFEQVDPKTKGLVISLDERRGIQWAIDPNSGNARRSVPRGTAKEIETCARCHSRRGQSFADYRYGEPLMNTHMPALLEKSLYHADGQIDGEVYEYGSLLQSKMFQAGVTCSDCHEPHSLKLRVAGNGVCLQCHGAEKYDSERHHFHRAGSEGTRCVDCHMPAKNYMVVDPRRDHSFRVPRPDLSAKLGTPNPCTGCHAGKPARWAAERIRQWYGHDPKGYQDYAEALHASRTAAANAEAGLVALVRAKDQPAIARATAVSELGHRLTQESFPAVSELLKDTDALVRAAAVEALEPLPPDQRWQAAHQLLRDPVRQVRAVAAGSLAGISMERIPPADQADFQRAAGEYLASQRLNADVPGAQVNLGNFQRALGNLKEAEAAYREALTLDPNWIPAYANLADLFRQSGRDTEGETLLRDGLVHQPNAAALHHSLGLVQVRQKNMKAAMKSLQRAAELAPEDSRYAYVYAVALHSAGRTREAKALVDASLKRAPGDPGLNQLKAQLAADAP